MIEINEIQIDAKQWDLFEGKDKEEIKTSWYGDKVTL